MFYDGYKYWMSYTKNNITYFRCARHKEDDRCPGRCTRLPNGTIRPTHAHTHDPNPDGRLIDAFRKVLNQRAIAEPTADLHKLYWDEANQRHLDAAMLYSFEAAESAMRKTRARQLERRAKQQRLEMHAQQPEYQPRTAQEVDGMLRGGGGGGDPSTAQMFRISGRNNNAVKSRRAAGDGPADESFYRATLKLSGGAVSCWIFAHLETLQRMDVVEQLHVDASLENVIPGFVVMVFHAVQAIGVFKKIHEIGLGSNIII